MQSVSDRYRKTLDYHVFFVSSQLASALEQIFTVITFEIFLRFVDKLVNLQSFRIFETLWILITYIWPLITVYFSVVP